MIRVMGDGVLMFECPLCDEWLEAGLHVRTIMTDPEGQESPSGCHYGHRVEFVAEAPHLHAVFWGHLVRCHGPDPHPYLSGADDDGLSMWQREYDRLHIDGAGETW